MSAEDDAPRDADDHGDADDVEREDVDSSDVSDEGPRPSSALPPPRNWLGAGKDAILACVVVTVIVGVAMRFVFDPERAGTPAMLIALAIPYAILGVITVGRLYVRGEIAQLRPANGDVAIAAAVAGVLYGCAQLTHMSLLGHGSPREAWLMRIYLQVGDPEASGRMLASFAIFGIAALEELVWRGLVLRAVQAAKGDRTALIVATALYGVAHIPTLFALADPVAGPNPLVVVAALGCGFVWGALVLRTKRLAPALFAHALFTWAIVEFPIWAP
jgi:hypothetical protein